MEYSGFAGWACSNCGACVAEARRTRARRRTPKTTALNDLGVTGLLGKGCEYAEAMHVFSPMAGEAIRFGRASKGDRKVSAPPITSAGNARGRGTRQRHPQCSTPADNVSGQRPEPGQPNTLTFSSAAGYMSVPPGRDRT